MVRHSYYDDRNESFGDEESKDVKTYKRHLVKMKSESDKENSWASSRVAAAIACCCCCVLIILAVILGVVLSNKDTSKSGNMSPADSQGGSFSTPSPTVAPRPTFPPVTAPPFPRPSLRPPPTNFPTVSPAPTIKITDSPTRGPTPYPTIAPTLTPSPTESVPERMVLNPIADNTIYKDGLGQIGLESHGTEESMLVQDGLDEKVEIPDAYSILAFDMSVVPPKERLCGVKPTAELQLFHERTQAQRGPATLNILRLPSTRLDIETLHGGFFFPYESESEPIEGPTFQVATSDPDVRIDITDLVFDNEFVFDQLFLMIENRGPEQEVGDRFKTRESDSPPKLILKFPGGGTGCPTTPIDEDATTFTFDPWNVIKAAAFEDTTASVGDTVTFKYVVGKFNVWIHPTGDCTQEERVLVGSGTDGEASYTFTEEDAGTVVTFVSDTSNHCERGMIVKFQVN